MKYVPQLDGIRCIALVSVLIAHWISWECDSDIIKYMPWHHGVLLFFVLSGYLITAILFELKEKIELKEITLSKAFRNFYARRVLRIFPIYYFIIFICYYINYENTREIFPWLVSYTSNFYMISHKIFTKFGAFWSLAVEEQFYLIWPFLILLTNKKNTINYIMVVVLISFVSKLISAFCFKDNGTVGSYFTLNSFLPLALGGILAYYKKYKPNAFKDIYCKRLFFYISAIIYCLVYYIMKKYDVEILKTVFEEYIFSVFAMFFVARAAISNFYHPGKFILENKLVVYLGTISYGLYAYHLFIGDIFWKVVSPGMHLSTDLKTTLWLLYFIILIVISTLSFYIIEKPINSLKKYFTY